METKFYVCPICGNVIMKLVDSGVIPTCCGEEMQLMEPNTTDGAGEKHVPKVSRLDACTLGVEVGIIPHPMSPDHYVHFIYLETETGGHICFLNPEYEPKAQFCCKDSPIAVYEYCNLHGLWKTSNMPIACLTEERKH